MALPFLRGETEENATQNMAFIAIVAITIGLALFNVCGAIVSTEPNSPLEYVIVVGFALVVSGAEFLAAVALVRVMLAKNWLRMVVGTLIFLGLAWVCVQNGKKAAHLVFPVFANSATLLEQQAKIAGEEATAEKDAKTAATNAVPALLREVQDDLAEAERKQRLLQAQSPEKIREMQQMLISEGYYFFQVDGKIGRETERAMRSMGEDLRNDIDRLEDQEARLMVGVTTVQANQQPETVPAELSEAAAFAALTPAGQQAVLEDQARQSRQAAIWIEVMLWVVEGARSFGLWALVTTIDSRTDKDKRNSERSRKGWKTRKESEEAEREQLKIGDHGYWSVQIIKALNNNMPRRTVKGMCNSFFGRMEPAALKVQLTRRMDERMELPKAFYQNGKGEVKRADRAIERGLLSEDHKTYLMQEHIDYILMQGEHAPKKKADEEPKPKQEANGEDHSTDLTIPELGADDADRPAA